MDKKTTDAVNSDKLVALVKLLPGYREPTYVTMGEGGILTTSTDTERKLEKQTMPLNQLLFALGKYKQLAEEAGNHAKVGDIDRHMQNIINISITHTDYVHFFTTPTCGRVSLQIHLRFEGPTSLRLTIARPTGRPNRANICNHCGTYTHSTEQCPFEPREEVGSRFQGKPSSSGWNQGNTGFRGNAGFRGNTGFQGKPSSSGWNQGNTVKPSNSRGKAPFKVAGTDNWFVVCRYFQTAPGCKVIGCEYKHVCMNCGGNNHWEARLQGWSTPMMG